ncbi:MAG TPA: YciI family protein [Nitrolancea sp.]|nr:YciI family protein [Nitrolancea sp.]
MRYMLMIFASEDPTVEMSEADVMAMYAGHEKFGAELGALGKMVGGEELQPSSTATVVKVRNGDTTTIDGPFVETKEQLGGFYLIEADDLDEAIQWAAKIPAGPTTTIEVRPVVDHSGGN